MADGAGVELSRSTFLPGSRPNFMHLRVPAGVTRVVLECGPPPDAAAGLQWSGVALALMALLVWLLPRLRLTPRT